MAMAEKTEAKISANEMASTPICPLGKRFQGQIGPAGSLSGSMTNRPPEIRGSIHSNSEPYSPKSPEHQVEYQFAHCARPFSPISGCFQVGQSLPFFIQPKPSVSRTPQIAPDASMKK